jgi:tetratricopeptide (TPR) repeat protein/TolB-like protein
MTLPRLVSLVFFLMLGAAPGAAPAQQSPGTKDKPDSATSQGIFLVFPFENAGASPRLDWLGEGLEELTIQRLSAAGQQVYSHAGRVAELERYGLPSTAKFSHATMLRIGVDLDADYVVFGSFTSDGEKLAVQARILRVHPAALEPAVEETGPLASLMELHTRLVWKLLGGNDAKYAVTLANFVKVQRALRLDAFEHYIRGLLANDDDLRTRELREAVRLEPEWPAPSFALGQTAFSRRDCDGAVTWFSRIPSTNSRYVEAEFTVGVCRLLQGQPDKAEALFSALQDSLKDDLVSGADLPEILNNVALARARQGKLTSAIPSLRRATDLDPDEDDYPFNLGLLYLAAKNPASAAGAFREACDREPENPEDRALLIYALEKAGKNDEAEDERSIAAEALGPNGIPKVKPDDLEKLERVTDELDTTALQLELVSGHAAPTAQSETGPIAAAAFVRQGRQQLSAGKLDTAEAAYRSALNAVPDYSAAHRGLAEVYRRQGKLDDAVRELEAALARRDSAVDRTTLARIYLDQKKPDQARKELEQALKLAPNYTAAKQLLERLQPAKPEGTKP